MESGRTKIRGALDPGRYVRLDPIDVLLTDITMPGMNGAEVADRVSAIRPGIRVVFMSGHAQPFLTQQGQLPSGVYLVEKPFTKAALLDAVTDTAAV